VTACPLQSSHSMFYCTNAWIRGSSFWLCYHDDYYMTLFMISTALLMFCLLMHVIIGLIKMAKVIKIRVNS
jgi:hypothetical protein